jgi:hypothetical protein
MGYLCACFELSNTARRLLFALREEVCAFRRPGGERGEALGSAGESSIPAPAANGGSEAAEAFFLAPAALAS